MTIDQAELLGEDPSWQVAHRHRAVLRVLDGVPVAQAAREAGASRQSLYSWLARYEADGLAGLADRSRRPHSSPTRMPAETEALICELRRSYPRWGARRIAHEIEQRGVPAAPGRSSVYRALTRNGMIVEQQQNHRRKYRRWQRDAPMQLWQMDIMGGVFLAGGRECKLVTGIDDHSRFVVIAAVVAEPSGRAVCAAFTTAMARYGVPSEVLTDNGKQFTGRFTKPLPAEVLFERVCREHGITQRLTKPRSPTTTGKIERWHKTLRRELLDAAGPFADQATAQAAIDAWVHAYNHTRPHQALDMATPASAFRPHPVTASVPAPRPVIEGSLADQTAVNLGSMIVPAPVGEPDAVEWEALISPGGRLCLPGNQQAKFAAALGGRTVTVWADDRSIHVLLDGHLIRTRPSRFSAPDLADLLMRGARPARPEPGPSALPPGPLNPFAVIEVERTIDRDGGVGLGGQRMMIDPPLAGQRVTLRFDGQLVHVISGNRLVKTLPAPVDPARRVKLTGARTSTSSLPPPPSGPLRAVRRVPADGVAMVAGQRLRVGRTYAGQTVTVMIEDTVFRVLLGDVEISTHARTNTKPVTRFKATARNRSS